MSKSYDLWLHYKQGDDFARQLEGKSVSEAFSSHAEHFLECAKVCTELSKRLRGVKVDVHADTHMIAFDPIDNEAREILEALVNEGVIQAQEYEDEEDDE